MTIQKDQHSGPPGAHGHGGGDHAHSGADDSHGGADDSHGGGDHSHGGGGHSGVDHNHGGVDRSHSGGHSHGGGGHSHHHHRGENSSERRLWIALMVLGGFTVVEGIGGFWAHSIALLAEAAHMMADCGSLILAIVAIRISRRPASASRTYGHRRYQPLAAYTNGLLLLGITAAVVVEAGQRLLSPPAVNGTLMLAVAIAGGIANLAAFLILSGASSLNEQGARAHVLSDLLGSVAAIAAALVILFFGWLPADPLLSLLVSILIFRSGWQLTADSAHILLEGSPTGFDADAVERELASLPEVRGIHHVHAWSLTGEAVMVTLHAQINEGADGDAALTEVTEFLYRRFGVDHATVQIEEGACPSPTGSTQCGGAL